MVTAAKPMVREDWNRDRVRHRLTHNAGILAPKKTDVAVDFVLERLDELVFEPQSFVEFVSPIIPLVL